VVLLRNKSCTLVYNTGRRGLKKGEERRAEDRAERHHNKLTMLLCLGGTQGGVLESQRGEPAPWAAGGGANLAGSLDGEFLYSDQTLKAGKSPMNWRGKCGAREKKSEGGESYG